MALTATKGEVVYECDVCSRRTRVSANRKSIDVVRRCIITANCKGKLHRIVTVKDINSTPAFPPEVAGVLDWSQRRILFTFNQTIRAAKWVVKHNLASKPIVNVYVERQVNDSTATTQVKIDPVAVNIIDDNNLEIIFSQPEQGTAQCIALASKNTANPSTVATQVLTDFQLTNQGQLTVALLASGPSFTPGGAKIGGFKISYNSPTSAFPVLIEYVDQPSPPGGASLSPWVGSSQAIINGRKYYIRTLNAVNTEPAANIFRSGAIASGSTLYFPDYTTPYQAIILLASAPYAAADRIYDKYIDAASISTVTPQLYYNSGNLYAPQSVIKSTYPPIIVA